VSALSRTSPKLGLLLIVATSFHIPAHAVDPSTAELIEDGHYKRALVILRERLKANPNDARANSEMSKVTQAFQHWDEAIAQAEKAVSLEGQNAQFHAALADALGAKLASAQLGTFEKLALARRFKKEAELTLQMDPNDIVANEDLMGFHLDAPGLVGGDKKKASELADRMIRINPVHGYLMAIEIATHEKHTAELEGLFQKALSADPRNYYAHVQAANYYLERGQADFPRAEELAKQAIQLNASRIGGYTTLAILYTRQERWKDLEALLETTRRLVSDDFSPDYQVAKTILTANLTDQLPIAEKLLHRYLSQQPEGNTPSLAAAHWRLGLVLAKENHKDQAKAELQQAMSLDPNFEPAKKDLKQLQ
jgi:tetratricopeptide (TPR) repeat protein